MAKLDIKTPISEVEVTDINGYVVNIPLATTGTVVSADYVIRTAELPNTDISLYRNGTLIQTQNTGSLGGKVEFSVSLAGDYKLQTSTWEKEFSITDVGLYKPGAGPLNSYTKEQLHTICQGGYFDLMFSPQDEWTFNQEGSILNGYKFFVEQIHRIGDKNVVDFRLCKPYEGATYPINPQFSYLTASTATTFSNTYSNNGGWKYCDFRKKFMRKGEAVYSQATSLKPEGSAIADGIEFSKLYYTDSGNTSGVYSYDKATDTMILDSEMAYFSSYSTAQSGCRFVKGYFKSVGSISESDFNSGHYYTYKSPTNVYTPATTYASGTTYYGFYETLQEDGIFVSALSSLSDYMLAFEDYSSAGGTQTQYLLETNDLVNIPAVEEITGINRNTTLPSGKTGQNIGCYNIPGEGSKKDGYDFKYHATGTDYWTRSTSSNYSSAFCAININGNVNYNSVYNSFRGRVGFRFV